MPSRVDHRPAGLKVDGRVDSQPGKLRVLPSHVTQLARTIDGIRHRVSWKVVKEGGRRAFRAVISQSRQKANGTRQTVSEADVDLLRDQSWTIGHVIWDHLQRLLSIKGGTDALQVSHQDDGFYAPEVKGIGDGFESAAEDETTAENDAPRLDVPAPTELPQMRDSVWGDD